MADPLNICVFCSSSDAIDRAYFDAAAELGGRIAQGGHTLIYGGGRTGLMGTVARAALGQGGKVVGVLPEKLNGHRQDGLGELIITRDLRERKALMEQHADAFIALPGGFGTLEETFEILTLKQLGYHRKAVVLLNTRGYYEHFAALLEHLYSERFAKETFRDLYALAAGAGAALQAVETYTPAELPGKWF